MAGKIRGITIELNGDTSGLNKSLSDTNKELKSTSSQLKDVEKLLKLDPTNTELLRQKQELLGKAIGETEDKLADLKKAEETMKNQGVDENSEQFMALQREITETENNLKSLKKEANNTTSALDKIAASAKKVGDAAQKVADKTKGLSTAGAAVAGSLLAAGGSAIQTADDLATLSKRTGISTSTLQKFAYASDMVDVSTDELAGAFKKMKINMSEHPEAFEALGVAVTDANGNFRDLESVFYDVLAALSQVGGETERDIASMDIFGKGADTLATIIDDGGASLKEYGDQAESLGLILSDDTITSLTETGDKIDTLKAQATSTIAELGAKVVDTLEPTLTKIIDKVSEVIEWIGNLDEDTLGMIITIALVVAAISPLASAIANVSGAITGATEVIDLLKTKNIDWSAILGVGAIIAVVAIIALKGDEIQEVLQQVDDFLQGVFATDWTEQFGEFGVVMNGFFDLVKEVWDSTKEIFDGVIDVIRGVFTGDWERAWKGVQEIFSGVFDGIEGIFDVFSGWLKDIFEKDWSESLGAVGDIINGLFATVGDVWEGIETTFKGIIDFIKNVFKGDWQGAWDSVKDIFKGVFDALVGIAKAPLNLIIGIINSLIDGINWMIDGFNRISIDVPDWVPIIGGKTFGFNLGHIGKLAYLASGGILTQGSAFVGENGPELLTMTGQGAVVQPLTNNTANHNYGGVTLNVYGAAGQSVQELAEIIMDEIGDATRRQEAAFA